MQQELIDLLDRENIRACLARLARGEDRRDEALIRSACWSDGTSDYGVFKGSFTDYLGWVIPGSDAITNTQHFLGQSLIELNGDQARVETHLISYHRVAGEEGQDSDMCIGGRYLDVMQKRDGEWRIFARTLIYDWDKHWGPSADWSHGVMGLPLASDDYYGKAHGDISTSFFGGDV